MDMNCFAKGCSLLLLVQGLRHAFVIFPILIPLCQPVTLSVYFQDKCVGSLCFDKAVIQCLLLSQHYFPKGLVGYEVK